MVAPIEREFELKKLNALLDDGGHRGKQVIMVNGPVGSGKSELVETLVQQAIDRRFQVFCATGSQQDRTLPFGILSQLLGSEREAAGHAQLALSSLNEMIVSALRSHRPEELEKRISWHILHVLHQVLVEVSQASPVLVVVDDIHHADRPSLTALLHLLRRSRATPIRMLFTTCPGASFNDPLSLRELRGQLTCRTIQLRMLSPAGVTRVLADRLGSPAAGQLAGTYHSVTGGNPLLVHALIDDKLAAGANMSAPYASLFGEAFRDAVLSLVQRVDSRASLLANAIAVLGESATSERLSKLLDLDNNQVIRLTHALKAAGILTGDAAFRHVATREAIASNSSSSDNETLSRNAAKLLHAEDAPPLEVAWHLMRAGPTPAAWAVQVLEEAAEQARVDGQPELAVKYLKRAHQSCTDKHHQATLTVTLAAATWRMDPHSATKYLTPIVTAARQGYLLGQHALTATWQLLWNGRFEEATDMLLRVSAESTRLDPSTSAELQVIGLWLRTTHPTLLTRIRRAAPAIFDGAGGSVLAHVDLRLQAAALLASVLTGSADQPAPAQAERLLQWLVPANNVPEPITAVSQALFALIYADRTDAAVAWADHLMQEPPAWWCPNWQAKLSSMAAEIAFRRGDLNLAAEYASAALRDMPAVSWGIGIGLPIGVLIAASTAMGQQEKAAYLLSQPVPADLFQTRYGLHYLHARGQHLLMTGGHHAALTDFLSCGAIMREWEMDLPALVPWRTGAAAAWLRLGDRVEAAKLAHDQLALLGDSRSRSKAISLRSLAAACDPPQRPPLLTEAVEIFDGCGDLRGKVHALTDLAQCLQSLGKHTQAKMAQYRVRHAVNGSPAALSRRDPLLIGRSKANGSSRPAIDRCPKLSSAERRVASLASQGYTNREISTKLFITISTVEQHLTRTYRKLGVKQRNDLPKSLSVDSSHIVYT